MAPSKTSPRGIRDTGAATEHRETARAIAALLPRPVPVAVRTSSRVQGVSLRFLPEKGLEVVTAPGIPADTLVKAVGQRREWLVRVCERLAAEGALPGILPEARPDWLVLTAFRRQWRIDYVARNRPDCRLTERGPAAVLVSGAVDDDTAVTGALTAFCREQAGRLLRQALAAASRESGLSYSGVTIRAQRTRWGSCTAKGRINLNFTLAFLPWELCRVVLLHELCHTKELNHSERFWALLERHMPGCRAIDARLATARHYLPLWLRRAFMAARQ